MMTLLQNSVIFYWEFVIIKWKMTLKMTFCMLLSNYRKSYRKTSLKSYTHNT